MQLKQGGEMVQNPEFFGWNDAIENDSDFPERLLLEPGDYNFQVLDLEKTYASSGAPMAKLTIKVYDDENRATNVWDNLVLQRNCEWKLSQFFRSIGQKKRGERIDMDWTKVEGAKGRCKIDKTSYTNNKGNEVEKNEIVKYYDPETPPESETVNVWATN